MSRTNTANREQPSMLRRRKGKISRSASPVKEILVQENQANGRTCATVESATEDKFRKEEKSPKKEL